MMLMERFVARAGPPRCSCEPATLGLISAGAGLAGSVIQGQAEVDAARAGVRSAEDLARYHQGVEALNSEIARRNIGLTEQAAADAAARGEVEAGRARAEGTQIIGAQRAGYAAGNIDVGSGSPVAVAADTRAMSELDAQTIRNNAFREAYGYKVQGADIATRDVLTRAEGQVERHQLREQARLNLQRAKQRRAGAILGGVASFGGSVFGALR